MLNSLSLKNQALHILSAMAILFVLLLTSHNSLAAQPAIVISERAIIYSDQQMSSALGYVVKGKKIVVGEIPRNKAQVYPITVSGKIGYIRIRDVSTEKQNLESDELIAERFLKSTEVSRNTRYAVSYMSYSTQISNTANNGSIQDKDDLKWSGVSLRGDLLMSPSWDISVLLNYLETSEARESYRMVEFGMGAGLRILEFSRLIFRWDSQLLAVPFSSYAVKSDYRLNGYGASVGTGLNLSLRIYEGLGLDFFGGYYYTKLLGFSAPKGYNSPQPSFLGTRLGMGFNYHY
jgi:hypothetical protein